MAKATNITWHESVITKKSEENKMAIKASFFGLLAYQDPENQPLQTP